jgi:hypothetical protein
VPPRYAYWTIIVDNQPTAFRSGSVEEIMPTFNRLKAKQPSAILKWFQNGKLWDSRLDAREAQERRGEEGRKHDKRQRQPFESPRRSSETLEWKPKTTAETRDLRPKLEWSPRQASPPSSPEKRARAPYKGGGKPRDSRPRDFKARYAKPRQTGDRPNLEWSPRETPATPRPEKRARPPFKSGGDERDAKPRDAKWRPGGDHRDPRQKYKDAKKAKWTRFKEAIHRRRGPRKP